jgi:hypothetical protein
VQDKTCGACYGPLGDVVVTDEEALKEYAELFPEQEGESVVVCGLCYEMLVNPDPHDMLKKYVSEITGKDVK